MVFEVSKYFQSTVHIYVYIGSVASYCRTRTRLPRRGLVGIHRPEGPGAGRKTFSVCAVFQYLGKERKLLSGLVYGWILRIQQKFSSFYPQNLFLCDKDAYLLFTQPKYLGSIVFCPTITDQSSDRRGSRYRCIYSNGPCNTRQS